MKKLSVALQLLLFMLCAPVGLGAQTTSNRPADTVSTRELERINWMEFRQTVPAKVQTVLLPTGTLEPHGVANNGADITAPLGICRRPILRPTLGRHFRFHPRLVCTRLGKAIQNSIRRRPMNILRR